MLSHPHSKVISLTFIYLFTPFSSAAHDHVAWGDATRDISYVSVATTQIRNTKAIIAARRLLASFISSKRGWSKPCCWEWVATTGEHHVNLLTRHCNRFSNPVLVTLRMSQQHLNLPYWCGAGSSKASQPNYEITVKYAVIAGFRVRCRSS